MKQTDVCELPALRLFCYGTLKRGYLNHQRFCKGAISIEEATVRGRLYRLPSGIPVLDVPHSDILAAGSDDVTHDLWIQDGVVVQTTTFGHDADWLVIRGELITLGRPDLGLVPIDSLEGYVPGLSCLYRRVLLPVHRQDGTVIAAWCYVLGMPNVHFRALNSSEWSL